MQSLIYWLKVRDDSSGDGSGLQELDPLFGVENELRLNDIVVIVSAIPVSIWSSVLFV
jgi:hypothetical protein